VRSPEGMLMEIAALDRDLAIEKSSGFDYKHQRIR
jgi:hypothetical protein